MTIAPYEQIKLMANQPPQYDHWRIVPDGYPPAARMYERHYSTKSPTTRGKRSWWPNRNLFIGPGEKLALMTHDDTALFAWRKFVDPSGQAGVGCTIFRNEGYARLSSSKLILLAELFARSKWPGERLYTYVRPAAIKSTNPGYCFQVAGWCKCGTTLGGLIVLEKCAIDQPD